MSDNVLVSICVPTKDRPEIIRSLLNSIVKQNVSHDFYEVCITDNSLNDDTMNVIKQEFAEIDNIHYKKVECPGFLNSVEALKFGNGKLLKLHNDYSIFRENALKEMIESVCAAREKEAGIFFSFGSLKQSDRMCVFNDYDSFMNHIGYYATWSSGFAIWKEDFDRFLETEIKPDTMFPHTTILHFQYYKKAYIVDDSEYVNNITPSKKGGYNLPDNFAHIYLHMVKEDLLYKKIIKTQTYKKIENQIIKFCAMWYRNTSTEPERYTFDFTNDRAIVKKETGRVGELKYCLWKRLFLCAYFFRNSGHHQ